jgi:hypothetical protein
MSYADNTDLLTDDVDNMTAAQKRTARAFLTYLWATGYKKTYTVNAKLFRFYLMCNTHNSDDGCGLGNHSFVRQDVWDMLDMSDYGPMQMICSLLDQGFVVRNEYRRYHWKVITLDYYRSRADGPLITINIKTDGTVRGYQVWARVFPVGSRLGEAFYDLDPGEVLSLRPAADLVDGISVEQEAAELAEAEAEANTLNPYERVGSTPVDGAATARVSLSTRDTVRLGMGMAGDLDAAASDAFLSFLADNSMSIAEAVRSRILGEHRRGRELDFRVTY